MSRSWKGGSAAVSVCRRWGKSPRGAGEGMVLTSEEDVVVSASKALRTGGGGSSPPPPLWLSALAQ